LATIAPPTPEEDDPMPRRRTRLPLALAAAAALAALPAAGTAAPAGPDRDPVVMAELAPFSERAAREVAERTGLALDGTIPEIGWASYAIPGDERAAHTVLRNDPGVWRIDFAAPGESLVMDLTPSDTIFTQPGQVAAGGLTASWNWHWTITNFPRAWDIARGDGNTRVAVIDSEFDTEHLELKPKLLTGRNFDSGTPAYGTSSVRATAQDLGTLHGTHVAGLVAAVSDNANGVTGACFDCAVIPYKISLRGGPPGATQTTDAKFVRDLTEALVDIAGRGDVRVVNMSLGTDRFHQPMQDAVNLALANGKVLVASSGNGQLSNPGVPNYPASFPGVIGVGATQPDDNIAPFSTNGDFVDVSAPGHGILSTWDNRIPPGAAPPVTPPTHGVGFVSLSGTSMAAPITAGLVALMLQLRPELSAGEVQSLLERSAVDLGVPGRDPVFGSGRIDAFATLRNTQAYVRPAPPAPPAPPARTRVRFAVSCTLGARTVPLGRRAFAAVPRGARVVCKGRTLPALRRATLEVQRFSARQGWKRVGRVRTNNKGRFGYTRRLTTLGNWRIRVAYAGDAALAPSASRDYKVRAVRRR
jgi:subtilisin family serine protease